MLEELTDHELVERLVDSCAKFGCASGPVISIMRESYRQDCVKCRDEVLRRFRELRSQVATLQPQTPV